MDKRAVLVLLAALLIFVIPVGAQEDVIDLDEVVVTASRYEEAIMDTPVSIEVISQEDIDNSDAANLADLLQRAGGVHIKDDGGLVANKDVLIRGFRGRQILILIDGQPYNNPQDGGLRLEAIPVEMIKRIEVLKSGASAIYGPGAMGGVINIITKDAADVDRTKVELGLGSYDTKKVNISNSFLGDNSSLVFVFDYLDSDDHRQNSYINRNDLFAKYNYQISNTSDINLSFRYNDTDTDYPGALISRRDGSREDTDRNLNLSWNQRLEDKDRRIAIYQNNREQFFITDDFFVDITKRGLNAKQTSYFTNHIISYGIDIDYNQVNYEDSYNEYEEENLNIGVFINDRYQINDKNIINIGLRYDDHEEYGSELSPSLGYIHRINENLNFNASIARSISPPTYLDLYYPGFSNPDLLPEKVISYDFGFKYNTTNTRSEITLFKRDGEDFISNLENLDSVDIKGFEMSTEREINDKWNLGFNYTYLDAKDEDDNQLIDMPEHEINLNILYNLANGRVSLNNRFLGNRTSVEDVEGFSSPIIDMPSHFVSDLKITNNLTDNTEMSIAVNNLFDREYEVVDGYPMPGRNFMLSLGTSF